MLVRVLHLSLGKLGMPCLNYLLVGASHSQFDLLPRVQMARKHVRMALPTFLLPMYNLITGHRHFVAYFCITVTMNLAELGSEFRTLYNTGVDSGFT
jgi:hypothetical protein